MFETPLLHGASVMVLDLFLALAGPVGLQEQVDLRVEVSSGGRGGSCGVKHLTPGIRGDGHIVRLLRLIIRVHIRLYSHAGAYEGAAAFLGKYRFLGILVPDMCYFVLQF